MDNGDNMVIPIVGADEASVIKYVEKFKAKGYKVYLHYNDLDQWKAAGRNLGRFASKGRFLDLRVTSFVYGDGPKLTFEALIQKEGLFDGYTEVNADTARGDDPELRRGTEKLNFSWRADSRRLDRRGRTPEQTDTRGADSQNTQSDRASERADGFLRGLHEENRITTDEAVETNEVDDGFDFSNLPMSVDLGAG